MRKAWPLVRDGLVKGDFTGTEPNEFWLPDIAEHFTA